MDHDERERLDAARQAGRVVTFARLYAEIAALTPHTFVLQIEAWRHANLAPRNLRWSVMVLSASSELVTSHLYADSPEHLLELVRIALTEAPPFEVAIEAVFTGGAATVVTQLGDAPLDVEPTTQPVTTKGNACS